MPSTNDQTSGAMTVEAARPPIEPTTARLWRNGLWTDNPALVQLLGLCPLLAVSNSAANGLGLGVATLITLLIANTSVSALRHLLQPAIRIPLYVLIIATAVTLLERSMQAWLPELHASLGIFLPLIVTNCLIMGRAEAFAARQRTRTAAVDALAMGCGFAAVLLTLGALRELLGRGTLFANVDTVLGPMATDWHWQLVNPDYGILLALLPPGAFIALGALLAIKNVIDKRATRAANGVDSSTAARRVG